MIYKIICSILALTAFCASAIEIKLPENPSVHEKNAAALLQKYLEGAEKGIFSEIYTPNSLEIY